MSGTGTLGFANAPISQALVLATAGSSIVLQAARAARRPAPTYVAIWEQLFCFRYPGELIFGVGLLYYFRLMERHNGTPRFGARVVVTAGLAYLLQLAATSWLGWKMSKGPYGLLFSCFVPFAMEVPPLQRFQLFGLRLTDKAFVYFAGLQLLISTPRLSAPAALMGILSGAAYQANLFGMKKWKLPGWASALFGQGGRRPIIRHAGGPGQSQQQQQQQFHEQPASTRQRAPAARQQPSAEAIAQLTAMGFDQASAGLALQHTGGDVNAAISLLV